MSEIRVISYTKRTEHKKKPKKGQNRAGLGKYSGIRREDKKELKITLADTYPPRKPPKARARPRRDGEFSLPGGQTSEATDLTITQITNEKITLGQIDGSKIVLGDTLTSTVTNSGIAHQATLQGGDVIAGYESDTGGAFPVDTITVIKSFPLTVDGILEATPKEIVKETLGKKILKRHKNTVKDNSSVNKATTVTKIYKIQTVKQ